MAQEEGSNSSSPIDEIGYITTVHYKRIDIYLSLVRELLCALQIEERDSTEIRAYKLLLTSIIKQKLNELIEA